jgi:hypothetical protein
LTLGRRAAHSPQARIAPGRQVGVTLSSVSIERYKGTRYQLAGATFRLDDGIEHAYAKSGPTEIGSKTTLILTTLSANAAADRLPATIEPLDAGLRPGSHTLTIKLHYKATLKSHGRHRVSRITHTLTATFNVC